MTENTSPAESRSAPVASWCPDADTLADAQLLLDGAYVPLTGFLGRADLAGVRSGGRLADGTPWPRAVVLPVPTGETVMTGTAVELTDAEGTPVAAVTVAEVVDDEQTGVRLLGGPVTARRPFEHGAFASRHRGPDAVRRTLAAGPALAAVISAPLLTTDLDVLGEHAQRLGATVLLLVPAGSDRRLLPYETLVRATDAAAATLPGQVVVEVLPLPRDADVRLHAHVAAAYGATHLLAPDAGPIDASPPIQLVASADTSADHRHLGALLDDGATVPVSLASAAVVRELARARRPKPERGVVVLLTGLSGSGKSTLARALYDRLAERGERTITYLDGDVVRRMLSAGLSFSRADRELNVRRIGYVAAEAARHGGLALCAPIAPYASMRAEMRQRAEQVGDFLLVHVSTPLAICEQRDRKGLYAKARAGLIPEFTGISDPYDAPTDADLTIDTASTTLADGVGQLMALLVNRGYLTEERR